MLLHKANCGSCSRLRAYSDSRPARLRWFRRSRRVARLHLETVLICLGLCAECAVVVPCIRAERSRFETRTVVGGTRRARVLGRAALSPVLREHGGPGLLVDLRWSKPLMPAPSDAFSVPAHLARETSRRTINAGTSSPSTPRRQSGRSATGGECVRNGGRIDLGYRRIYPRPGTQTTIRPC